MEPKRLVVTSGVLLTASGALVSYSSYSLRSFGFNPAQALGSVLFWGGLALLAGGLFLAESYALASRYVKTRAGALIGSVYLVAHLLLYGFVLEGIIVMLYGVPPYVPSSLVFLSSDVLYPATPLNAVVSMAFSPNVNIQFPPVYELSLTVFSVVVAVIVDMLILANVAKVREIGSSGWARSRAYFAMPAAGILLGASCCMSLPVVLSFASPTLAEEVSFGWAYFVTYFVLPMLGIVVLKFNLDLAGRVARRAAAASGS